jgi:hypothetical protein
MSWMPSMGVEPFPAASATTELLLRFIRRALVLVGVSSTLRDDPLSARRAGDEARRLLLTVTQIYSSTSFDTASHERVRRGIQLLNRALESAGR